MTQKQKQKEIEERVIKEAICCKTTGITIRQIAQQFNVSKSTVHKDLNERLPNLMIGLSTDVANVLKKHKDERHIKGGESTKRKYSKQKELN